MTSEEKRIDELAARLDRVERTVVMRRELHQLEQSERSSKVEAREKELAQERRDTAKPRRLELFGRFKASRLIVGLGRRATTGHLQKAYNEFLDELDPKPNRHERLYPHELIEAVTSLSGVICAEVRNRIGTRVDGFEGICVTDEYRQNSDAGDDSTLVQRAEKQRLTALET